MSTQRILQLTASVAIVSLFAGCSGNGNGNAGGPGLVGGSSDFETEYGKVEKIAPTSNMPTSLNATYTGQVKLGVNSGKYLIDGVDANNAEILGDVELKVNWKDGQTKNPFTGKATNFTATEAGTSNTIALDGDLNVNTAKPGSISRVVTPSQVIAGQTIPELRTGAFSVLMDGKLTDGTKTGDVTLLLGGNFMGSGAKSMLGTASGGVKDVKSKNPAIFDAGLGGVFYANR